MRPVLGWVILQNIDRPGISMLIPAALFAVIAGFASAFFFLNSTGKKVSAKTFIIYSLFVILAYTTLGLAALINIASPLSYYIWTQMGALALGVIHCFSFSLLTGKDEENKTFWQQVVFTFYVMLLGSLIYYVLFGFLNHNGYSTIFMTSAMLAFLIPFFFYKSFDFYYAMPAPEYMKWYFPMDMNEEDITSPTEDLEDANTFLLRLELLQKETSTDIKLESKVKAPYRMELGAYYAAILLQWNDAYPGKQIEYLDKFGQPQGWNFYIKPKWYQNPRYLDPKQSIAENEIKLTEVVVCERV